MKRCACSHGASEYKEANVLKTDAQSARHTSAKRGLMGTDKREWKRWKGQWREKIKNGEMH